MERWRGRTALVTGASAGIGYCLTETLARLGVDVIGCARNTDKIQELKRSLSNEKGAGSVDSIQCDVSKEKDVLNMFAQIERQDQHIDILVNNAGITRPDNLLTGETEKWREVLEINILGLSMCAREAMKSMAKHQVTDGHIININSILGTYMPRVEALHFYSATKHMVRALSEALYQEAKASPGGKHLRVTNLSPGVVETPGLRDLYTRITGKADDGAPMRPFKILEARDVVDSVIFVLSAPVHVCIKEMIIAPTEQLVPS